MIHHFTVGDLSCAVISDGQPRPPWEPPLAEFFTPATGVPERELSAAAAGRTTLTCGYNCVAVATGAGTAVIDAGLGRGFTGYGPELAPLYGRLADGLAEAGLAAWETAAVVFTHLHEDHTRGALAAFPTASGFAHAAEVAYWKEATSLPDVRRRPALDAIAAFGDRLREVEYGEEILPHVHTVDAAGHTPGHTAILLRSRGERLLCVGDSFYDPLQLAHPAWRTPWDHDAERSVRSRRRLLAWAADENVPVHAYHLPFPGLGRVERWGDAFAWRPGL